MTTDAPVERRKQAKELNRAARDLNSELKNSGIVSYRSDSVGKNRMNEQEVVENPLPKYPSAFAISVVLGGLIGMGAASALNFPTTWGFFAGFGAMFTVFVSLATSK